MTVSIVNFQSIANATLNFSGYSCIVGQSDMGKSAVRRAITTALFNQWDKSYIRNNTKQTQIKLKHNNTSIALLKSKTDNEFTINGNHIPKMGKDSPDLPTYDKELNITTQLEPLYMVSYRDTDNTKILNDMFGVTKIEIAQQLCNTDNRRTKEKIKIYQEQLDEAQSKIKDQELKTLKLQETYSFLKETVELKETIEQYNQVKEQHNKLMSDLKEASVGIDKLESDLKALTSYNEGSKYISLLDKKAKIENALNKTPSYTPVKGINSLLKYTQTRFKKTAAEIKLAELSVDIPNIEKQLEKYTCPTCKQPLRSLK